MDRGSVEGVAYGKNIYLCDREDRSSLKLMPNPSTSLRAARKRTGLTQEDMVYLLGGTTAGMVCRHEKGTRTPTVEMALGYALIHGVEARELFGNLELRIRTRIGEKAATLFSMSHGSPSDPRAARRRLALERLCTLRGSIFS